MSLFSNYDNSALSQAVKQLWVFCFQFQQLCSKYLSSQATTSLFVFSIPRTLFLVCIQSNNHQSFPHSNNSECPCSPTSLSVFPVRHLWVSIQSNSQSSPAVPCSQRWTPAVYKKFSTRTAIKYSDWFLGNHNEYFALGQAVFCH